MLSLIGSVVSWLLGLITGKKQDTARELGRTEAELAQRKEDAAVIQKAQEAVKHVDQDVEGDPDNLDGVRSPNPPRL